MLGRLFAPPCGGFRPIGLIPGGGAIPGVVPVVVPPRIPGGGAIPGVAGPPRDAPRPQPAFGRCIPIPGGGGGAAAPPAPVVFVPGRRGGDREFRRCLPPDITMRVRARPRLATLGGSRIVWIERLYLGFCIYMGIHYIGYREEVHLTDSMTPDSRLRLRRGY